MNTDRAEYIKGLRALADILANNDEVPLPYEGSIGSIAFNFWGWEYDDDEALRTAMAATRRAIGGHWDKEPGENYFKLTRDLHGLSLELCAPRDQVCTRVVTGSHEETVQEPVSFKTVTKTVEDVEWVCEPLLTEVSA